MLAFDLEFYVDPKVRNASNTSLIMNPARKGNIVLGGTFYPYQPKEKNFGPSKLKDFWIWQEELFDPHNPESFEQCELRILKRIYDYIDTYATEDWKRREKYRKKMGYPNPAKKRILYTGIGIARTDLPILYIRSSNHAIASNEELFELYLSHHPFDLANACFGLINPQKLEPVRAREIFKHFNAEFNKNSSKSVWEMFEQGEFQQILNRTHEELKATLYALKKIQKLIDDDRSES